MTSHSDSDEGDVTHIASFVIRCLPEHFHQIQGAIHQPPRVEVTHTSGDCKMVIVAECRSTWEVTELLDRFGQIRGVLNVGLVYHQMESTKELDEVVS